MPASDPKRFRAADLIWFRVERGNHAVWLWHVSDIRRCPLSPSLRPRTIPSKKSPAEAGLVRSKRGLGGWEACSVLACSYGPDVQAQGASRTCDPEKGPARRRGQESNRRNAPTEKYTSKPSGGRPLRPSSPPV